MQEKYPNNELQLANSNNAIMPNANNAMMVFNPDINFRERATGYPNPQQYDQYYINNYSLPKGLNVVHGSKLEKKQLIQKGLYDLKMPKHRIGIS